MGAFTRAFGGNPTAIATGTASSSGGSSSLSIDNTQSPSQPLPTPAGPSYSAASAPGPAGAPASSLQPPTMGNPYFAQSAGAQLIALLSDVALVASTAEVLESRNTNRLVFQMYTQGMHQIQLEADHTQAEVAQAQAAIQGAVVQMAVGIALIAGMAAVSAAFAGHSASMSGGPKIEVENATAPAAAAPAEAPIADSATGDVTISGGGGSSSSATDADAPPVGADGAAPEADAPLIASALPPSIDPTVSIAAGGPPSTPISITQTTGGGTTAAVAPPTDATSSVSAPVITENTNVVAGGPVGTVAPQTSSQASVQVANSAPTTPATPPSNPNPSGEAAGEVTPPQAVVTADRTPHMEQTQDGGRSGANKPTKGDGSTTGPLASTTLPKSPISIEGSEIEAASKKGGPDGASSTSANQAATEVDKPTTSKTEDGDETEETETPRDKHWTATLFDLVLSEGDTVMEIGRQADIIVTQEGKLDYLQTVLGIEQSQAATKAFVSLLKTDIGLFQQDLSDLNNMIDGTIQAIKAIAQQTNEMTKLPLP